MSSAFDDEDLALAISSSQPDRSNGHRAPPAGTPAAARTQQTSDSRRRSERDSRIGAYNVVKTLGEGSFGKVKLATHNQTGQKVALKIISRRKLAARDMAGRVEREISYLQLLRHPHIIKLYTVIMTQTEIVMVLEYAGGELFEYIVTNGKMQEDRARKFFQQIICAVEYCHRHKIVHRDLKPENLLLDDQLNVKIADFGLSNIMTDGNFLKTSCGSPNYAAPEVISGKLYAGPEVDVWSCGVILYVLLAGRLPFDDDYIPALFKKIAQGTYVVPSFLSEGAKRLIKSMLQISPVQRATIQDIRDDPWFRKDLPQYLQTPVENFVDTGLDPNNPIDPTKLGKGVEAAKQEELHRHVVGKLGKTMGYAPDDVQEALSADVPSMIKDAYLIIRENQQMMQDAPTLAQQNTSFMAQSPPGISVRGPFKRPPLSPLSSSGIPRHGSTGSQTIIESRSPASTVAILPSSLPDYHAAYMKGHIHKSHSPTVDESPLDSSRPRTKEEQEIARNRLKPHSKSFTNVRHADKPEPLTSRESEDQPRVKKRKPTKWQFGIRSRNSPAEAMLAIFKALIKMGGEWEIPGIRTPGTTGDEEDEPEPRREGGEDSNSPEYSDSDPGPGSDPDYATHEEQEKRRAQRRQDQGRSRDRPGRWNDWGYHVPADPWVIHARFKKDGMLPTGQGYPASGPSSQVNLHDSKPSPSRAGMALHDSLTANVQSEPDTDSAYASEDTSVPRENAWLYVTIQLYSVEDHVYLVDFKCAGYERLVRRFGKVLSESTDYMVDIDRAPPGHTPEDGDIDGHGQELVGAGRTTDEKDIASPYPFLDVASRLIIQLAENND